MKNILIVSGSRGIGLALVEKYLRDSHNHQVVATYRGEVAEGPLTSLKRDFPNRLQLLPFDAENEDSYETLVRGLHGLQVSSIDLVICSLGLLHTSSHMPERKLEELDLNFLKQIFTVNTFSVALIAARLKPFMKLSESPVFVAISAKVGSIEDNKMGGWYSYRASKAALNMMIKNISIEMSRINRNFIGISLHPGTTETGLSAPFQAGAKKKYTVHTAEATAEHISAVISGLELQDNGHFFSWDGTKLPW